MNDEAKYHEGSGEPARPPGDGASETPYGGGAGPVPPYEGQGERWRLPRGGGKSPTVAGILSFMPGLGQIYVGYYTRGFLHIAIVAAVITLLASDGVRGMEPFFGLFLAFFWLYNVIDAARRASAYNRLMATGRGGEELPDLPDELGSRTAGGILVALGVVLLGHTRFDFDLYWLEDWWPAGLILLGAYILRRGRK